MPNTNDRFVALRTLKHGKDTFHAGDLLPENFGREAHRTIDALLGNGDVEKAVVMAESAPNPDGSNASGEGAGSAASEDNESGNTEENSNGEGNDADGEGTNGEGEGEQSEPTDPTVTPSGYTPAEHNVEDVVSYVEENPDEREAVIAAEEARGDKARKTVLAQLRVDPPAAD